jgi:hypothetical protein
MVFRWIYFVCIIYCFDICLSFVGTGGYGGVNPYLSVDMGDLMR